MTKEYDKASEDIPVKFFESENNLNWIFIITSTSILSSQFISNNSIPSFVLSTSSAAVFITGRMMDYYSTFKGLKVIQQAEELGIEPGFKEIGKFKGEKPTEESILAHPIRYLEIILTALTPLIPAWGLAGGIDGGLVALNNSRKTQRLKRAIEIAQENSTTNNINSKIHP